MATTQYIGARYVPLFSDPLDWDNTKAYEALTIVYYQGNSYTSRQSVPKGVEITNDKYWALTGNYNAQIETYRKEVTEVVGKADAAVEKASEAETKVSTEETRATNAENELATGISNLGTRITEAEAKVTAEETRAKAAEQENADALAKMELVAAFIQPEYIGRFAYQNTSTLEYSAQGACIHDGKLISACADTTNNTAIIFTNEIGTNEVNTYENRKGFYHAQSMASDGNTIYVVPLYDGSTHFKTISTMSPSTYQKINEFDISIYPYNIAYDEVTGKMYVMEDSSDRSIYELNMSTHEVTKVFTPEDASKYLVQDFCVNNNVFYVAFYTPTVIRSYDKTGQTISITQLPSVIGFHDAQEIESINWYEDKLYCTFNGYQSNAMTKFNVCAVVDTKKGNMYVTPDNPAAYAARIRAYATAANINSKFYFDGTESSPFPSIQEAAMVMFYDSYIYTVQASGVFSDGITCSQNGSMISVSGGGYSVRPTIKNVRCQGEIQLSNVIVDGNGETNAVDSDSGDIYCYNTDISNATNGIRSEKGNFVRIVGSCNISVSGSKVYMSSAGILNVPSSFSASDVHWTQSGKILTSN